MNKLCTTNNTFGTVKYEPNVIESIDFMLDYLYEHNLIPTATKAEVKSQLINKLIQSITPELKDSWACGLEDQSSL